MCLLHQSHVCFSLVHSVLFPVLFWCLTLLSFWIPSTNWRCVFHCGSWSRSVNCSSASMALAAFYLSPQVSAPVVYVPGAAKREQGWWPAPPGLVIWFPHWLLAICLKVYGLRLQCHLFRKPPNKPLHSPIKSVVNSSVTHSAQSKTYKLQ